MRKNELVIFGRSPFIDKVDVGHILQNYTTVGFNHFGQHYPVDHLFYYDKYYEDIRDDVGKVWVPYHWPKPPRDSMCYAPRPSKKPFVPAKWFNNPSGGKCPVLGHCYFTVSLAINWALIQGYTRIHLVGIDHIETDSQFKHHDNIDAPNRLTPLVHKGIKSYIELSANYAQIFQTNPDVWDDWNLPKLNVESLYNVIEE